MINRDRLRNRIHEIIFEADTTAGKVFDVALLIFIVTSVLAVMLESVDPIQEKYGNWFYYLEWLLTGLFTIEYILRLYSLRRPLQYATSFYGIIDLISILPSYLSLFVNVNHSLLVIRGLRLLRVFRIFKLGHFMSESEIIAKALVASRGKITVFFFFVLIMVVIIGSVMYLVEGNYPNTAFTSIPKSVYWAIVTLTTVGFGDITPQTDLGQFLSAVVMILGYAVLAVPTGIVSAELIKPIKNKLNTQSCRYCSKEGHDNDALYCKYCGERLNE